MTPSIRRDVIRRLSRALDVQGVAAITVIGGDTDAQRLAVSVFASGGSEPDVFLSICRTRRV